jgi:hypothetical protein
MKINFLITLFLICSSFSGNQIFSQILPQLRTVDCNRTNFAPTYSLYANLTGGIQYKFEVTNTTLGITDSLVSVDRVFSISELPLVSRNNCSYNIRVKIDFGLGFGFYGPICSVITAPIITQLRAVDCPRSLVWLNYPVYASQLTADSWDFEVRLQSNPATSEIVLNKPTREFKLTMTVSSVFQQYSTTYEVRCRTVQGGVVQPWGGWCQITTPSLIPPQITSGCGLTFEYLAYEYITCTNIPTAQTYKWRLRIGSTVVDTLHTAINQVRICDFLDNSNLPNYDYNTTYNISCQVYDGLGWSSYGSACNVTTTSEPHTEVQPSMNPCGSTVNMLNTPIYVYAIWNATQYIYEVTDLTGDDGIQILTKTTKTFKLNELGQYSYGHTYRIRCRVTFKGVTYSYGSTCDILAPPPVVTLRPADCPKTLTSLGQLFYANNTLTFDFPAGLSPVNTYKFRVNGIESPWQSSRAINLQTILGSAPSYNTAYTVFVKTTYDGIEQPYGNGCVITTPIAISTDDDGIDNLSDEISKSAFNLLGDIIIYPNPTNSYFNIDFGCSKEPNGDRKILITVRNLSGQEIWTGNNSSCEVDNLRLGENWDQGVYFIEINDEFSNSTRKTIIKY